MYAQDDNKLCEYSYYIDNYYQCVITGDKCIHATPDGKNCNSVRERFLRLKKKGERNKNANTDEQ